MGRGRLSIGLQKARSRPFQVAKDSIGSPRDHAGTVHLADAGACSGTKKQDSGSHPKKDMLMFCAKYRKFQDTSDSDGSIPLTL